MPVTVNGPSWAAFAQVKLAFLCVEYGIPERVLSELDHDITASIQKLSISSNTLQGNIITSPPKISRKALHITITILSDHRLITGSVIPIVGYPQRCWITHYHFGIRSFWS